MRLAVGEFAAHGDDFGELEIAVVADELENILSLEVAQVHVQKHHMRAELLALDASFEPAMSDADFIARLFAQHFLKHFN